MILREEQAEDYWRVEALYDLVFAPGREGLSSYRLREGVTPVQDLCLIAVDDLSEGMPIGGAIRFWPVQIGSLPVLLLGPLAVHPTHQGEGLGSMLIFTGLELAKTLGWKRVLLVGDAPYYGRFGFEKLENIWMPPPTNPERVLGKSLNSPGWKGLEGNVVRFDAGEEQNILS